MEKSLQSSPPAKDKQYLNKLYNDWVSRGDRGSINIKTFQKEAKKQLGISLTAAKASAFLQSQPSYGEVAQTAASAVRTRRRNPYRASLPGRLQADLADMRNFWPTLNKRCVFLFIGVDIFSRYLFVVPMTSKKASVCLRAIAGVLQASPFRIREIAIDGESGVRSRLVTAFLEDNGIALSKPISAQLAEAKIRLLRRVLGRKIAASGDKRYLDYLKAFVEQENGRKWRHGFSPKQLALEPWLAATKQHDCLVHNAPKSSRIHPTFLHVLAVVRFFSNSMKKVAALGQKESRLFPEKNYSKLAVITRIQTHQPFPMIELYDLETCNKIMHHFYETDLKPVHYADK